MSHAVAARATREPTAAESTAARMATAGIAACSRGRGSEHQQAQGYSRQRGPQLHASHKSSLRIRASSGPLDSSGPNDTTVTAFQAIAAKVELQTRGQPRERAAASPSRE